MSENILAYSDYKVEHKEEIFGEFNIPKIETRAVKFLGELLKNPYNTIIVGERGIGKSITARITVMKLVFESKKIVFSSDKEMTNLYDNLWNKIVGSGLTEYEDDLNKKVKEFILNNHQIPIFNWAGEGSGYCRYFQCRRKERCYFHYSNENYPTIEEILSSLWNISHPCPLKRFILKRLLEQTYTIEYFRNNKYSFLIDNPEKFNKADAQIFNEFIPLLLRLGNVVILMDEEDYNICNKFKNYSSLPKLNFPEPTTEEQLAILTERIKQLPIEVTGKMNRNLKKICETTRNPRQIIIQANTLIMIEKFGYSLPSKNIIQIPESVQTDERRIVLRIMSNFKGWTKVKRIKEALDKQDIIISDRKIGRILKKEGIEHRYNPDSEYLI